MAPKSLLTSVILIILILLLKIVFMFEKKAYCLPENRSFV